MDNAREKRSLGTAIKTAREQQGISQRRFALMTGTSRSYLWKVESGSADVGIDILCKIARALDMNVGDLIDF
ncbi:MAG: helix-turn-helix transcriptional regulator [Slackia sp.]|nr:helix-turn-helix transcriptional regulator [Slackia sp.]